MTLLFSIDEVRFCVYEHFSRIDGTEGCLEYLDTLTRHFLEMVLNREITFSDIDYVAMVLDFGYVDMGDIYNVYHRITAIISPIISWLVDNILDKRRLGLLYVEGVYARLISVHRSRYNDDHYAHLLLSTLSNAEDSDYDDDDHLN